MLLIANLNKGQGIRFYFSAFSFLVLSILVGSRLEYNDTLTYIFNFNSIDVSLGYENIFDLSKIGSNPLFFNIQVFFKKFVSNNPYFFILFLSMFTTLSFAIFFYKTKLPLTTIFLVYICFGPFLLGMGALKQILAMSIGIIFVSDFIYNNSLRKYWVLIVASLIHPFVILYTLVIYLSDNIWDNKKRLAFLMLLILGPLISKVIGLILSMLSSIDVNYSQEYIENSQGGSVIRLAVYSIPVLFSYIYRGFITDSIDRLGIVAINASIVSFSFFYLGVFSSANMFGRLSGYFDLISIIATVWLVYNLPMSRITRMVVIFSMYISYPIFLYYELVVKRSFNYESFLFEFLF